ncbi:MAG TPA: hypothetical protein VFZ08_06045 [Terriglobia bacterium]|nr:hypothetical protein [Terriglobia bacterium]
MPILTHMSSKSLLAILLLILASSIALAAQTQPQAREPEQVAPEPSPAQIAQKSRQNHAKESQIPLYTNDNLPHGPAGISIIGPGSGPESNSGAAEEPEAASARDVPHLRYQLSQAQQRLGMAQREMNVFEQKLSQSKMQYYPDPNKSLFQEYSRQDINKLTSDMNQKRQEIAEAQKEISNLEDQIQEAQRAAGFTGTAAQKPESALPPGVKPGTKAYWDALLAEAQQRVSTAQEEEQLAENELQLLKLQQLRTLDPNLHASLAARISAKQTEIAAAKQAVEQAKQELEKLQKEMQASQASGK